ncbi:MAG: DUF192 domain-containing protein [bacterium]
MAAKIRLKDFIEIKIKNKKLLYDGANKMNMSYKQYIFWSSIFVIVASVIGTTHLLYIPKTLQVCQETACFNVELAVTPAQREQGLMFRNARNKSQGMLFVFPKRGFYDFWMKNTKLPLDMIWLDDKKRIVDIQEAMPCISQQCPVYHPKNEAQYVLEFPQGTAKKGLRKQGSQFSFARDYFFTLR